MDSPTPAGQSDQPRFDRPLKLGVLLVHGIGEPRRGDTLVNWLDTIVATINAATQNRFVAMVERADLGNRSRGSGYTPAHAVVRIQGDGVDESWMVAEARWAETFMAPSFAKLVTWGFRAIPWTIAMHVAQKYRRRSEQGERIRWVLTRAWTVAQLLGTLFLAPFIVLGLALLLFIGLIPIDAIRTRVGAVQRTLAATTGDSLVFLESPVTAAAICSEVMAAFAWLRGICDSVACDRSVILAHSQGAAVTLEAMSRMEASSTAREPDEARRKRGRLTASVLVTFGAGISKLAALRSLTDYNGFGNKEKVAANDSFLERDPIRIACLSLLCAAATGAGFWKLIATGQITVRQLWLVPAVWFGGSLLFGLAVTGSQRIVERFGESRPWLQKLLIAVTVGLFSVAVIGGVVAAETTHTPVMPFILLFVILVVLSGALRSTLSKDVQERIVQNIRKPANVETWLDYWASADPVPNGNTRSKESNVPVSTMIWNEASLSRDHTTYWQNRDCFVLPIVRILMDVARSAGRGSLPCETENIVARSRWRTGWLRVTRWFVPFIVLLAGLVRGPDLEAMARKLITGDSFVMPKWMSWLPLSVWAPIFHWVLVAACAWAAYRIVLALWHLWVRAEQDQVLRQKMLSDTTFGLRMFAWGTTFVTIAPLYFARTDWSGIQANWNLADLGSAGVVLIVISIWSQILLWLAVKAFPPPGNVVTASAGSGKNSQSKTQAGGLHS